MCERLHVQVLIDAMKHTLPGLSFTDDAFSRGLVDPDTVELILRDVPLPADEVYVCRAVASWAEAYFGDPDTSGEFAGYIPVSDNIMKHIDLMFVSRNDLYEVRGVLLASVIDSWRCRWSRTACSGACTQPLHVM